MLRTFVALTCLTCACAPVPQPETSPQSCPYLVPPGSDPYWANTTSSVLRLVGRYDLFAVTVSDGPPVWTWQTELTLTTTDSLFRPIPAPDTGAIYAPWLAGTIRWKSQDGEGVWRHDTVQVEYDTMYVGCRHCNDGVVVDYHIIAITPYGFWGLWIDRQTGLGSIVDSTGRLLPNPAGHFCARRK